MGIANDMMEEVHESQRIARQALDQRNALAEALNDMLPLAKLAIGETSHQ